MEKELLCTTSGALLGLSGMLDVALQCITHEAFLQADHRCLNKVQQLIEFLPNHNLHQSSRALTAGVCTLNSLTEGQKAALKTTNPTYSPACEMLLQVACEQINQAVRTRINPDETRTQCTRQELRSLGETLSRLNSVYYHLYGDFNKQTLKLECIIQDTLKGNSHE